MEQVAFCMQWQTGHPALDKVERQGPTAEVVSLLPQVHHCTYNPYFTCTHMYTHPTVPFAGMINLVDSFEE